MTMKTMTYTLSLLVLLVFTAGCNDGPAEKAGENIDQMVETHKQELEEAKKEIDEAKEELQAQQEQLAQARKERDEAMMRLQASEQERQRVLEIMEDPTLAEKNADAQVTDAQVNEAQVVEEQKEISDIKPNDEQSDAEPQPSGSTQ